MSTITDFGLTGAALLQRLSEQAIATKGVLGGAAAPLLAAGIAYSEAGRNGFQAMGSDLSRPDPQRLTALALGRYFGQALGILSTTFGPSGTVGTFDGLLAEPAPSDLSSFDSFFPSVTPLVTISPAAQAALDVLRRDPLTLGADAAPLVDLMAVVVAGVVLP